MQNEDSSLQRFKVAGWHIDATTHRISKNGKSTRLEPRTMALLVYLADHRGKAVTREELERGVWAGMVVGYDALSSTIAKLRKAFGDDSRKARVIETIPKVGYRLIAEVTPAVEAGPTFATNDLNLDLERKLAAVLYADVAEYSRLTGEDEVGTHRTLSTFLDVITATVQSYGGKVVHFAGDAVLAEFATVSDALICALVVQEELAIRNEGIVEERQLRFRIGVNLGEVIVDRNDIYGDGVNIAARLESLANPGEVYVSGAVFDAVGDKLPLEYEFLGEQRVKNLAKPVRTYHVRLRPGTKLPMPVGLRKKRSPRYAMATTFVGIAVILTVTGAVALLKPWVPREEPASVERMTFPLPDRPSIVVLPFATDDADQEDLAYGMTEDLITDLSKISGLFVISHNSSSTYDDSASTRQVAEELGVQYVLLGSVRRESGRIRINARLSDTTTGIQLWSARYDGNDTDQFALGDRVIERIISALELELTDAERTQIGKIPTSNLEAYDYYLKAERLLYKYFGSARQEAMALYRTAIDLDPEFADAYAGDAEAAYQLWRDSSDDIMPGPVARKRAYESASRALELDESSTRAYAVLALLQSTEGRHDEAITSAETGIELDPSNPTSYRYLAKVLVFAGQHELALEKMEAARRLDPKPPVDFYSELGWVLFFARRYEQALDQLETARARGAEPWETLAMTYAMLGRFNDAKAIWDNEILARRPFANLAYYRALYANHKLEDDLQHRIEALGKAGAPAWPYSYEPPFGDPVDAGSLKTLTVGRAWAGLTLTGFQFVQQFTDDGRVVLRAANSLLIGTTWMDRNQLCIDFPASVLLREDCGYVYPNPGGTPAESNEFVRVGLGDVYFFSVSP